MRLASRRRSVQMAGQLAFLPANSGGLEATASTKCTDSYRSWHIANPFCTAKLTRYQDKADIEQIALVIRDFKCTPLSKTGPAAHCWEAQRASSSNESLLSFSRLAVGWMSRGTAVKIGIGRDCCERATFLHRPRKERVLLRLDVVSR